jgi:HEAT repeat protein
MYQTPFCRCCVACVVAAVLAITNPARAAGDAKEKQLLAVLQSDAPASQKAMTCKQLAIYGGDDSVPALAELLADRQLSSWARIALEAIPGPAADKALRKAAADLDGRLLVGVINSIGFRRDEGAIDTLVQRLKDSDEGVVSAAAVALGRVGNAQATRALEQSLADARGSVRTDVARAIILSAERRLADGNTAEAVRLYDKLRAADLPEQRILEATRGAILARRSDGVPMLVELLRSDDKRRFALGLTTTRAMLGPEVTRAIIAELRQAAPDRQVLFIHALADRNAAAVMPTVLQAATSGPKTVRVAALQVLPRVADASCVPALLKVAIEPDEELTQAAKVVLQKLEGKDVDQRIAARLGEADGKMREVLIELAGRRRIADAKSKLLEAADDSDAQIRAVALAALGRMVGLRDISVLITRVVSPKHPEDKRAAEEALRYACVRIPDREACAEQLVSAMPRAEVPARCTVLEVLAAMGGQTALETIGAAAKDQNRDLQDTASRLLGVWMTTDAAPVLLDLATSTESRHRIRALRGYIRIARQFELPVDERAQMCRNALRIAQRTDEKALLLPILEKYPSKEMLEMVVGLASIPELKDDATRISLVVVQKVSNSADEYEKVLAQLGLESMKVVINQAEYGAGSNFKDVTAVLRRHVKDFPLVVLRASSYNRSFGGDPAPGFEKKLKITYTINGKKGQVALPENATIMLPLPEGL